MRTPALSPSDVQRIDRWWNVVPGLRNRKLPVSAMARILKVTKNTIYAAANRKDAYRLVPRG